MMIKTYNYLLENSKFHLISGKFNEMESGIEFELFSDYRMVLVPEDETWENKCGIYTYLVSKKFSEIMNELFNDEIGYNYHSIAHKYLPRKLQKDSIGCLGFGLASLESTNNRRELYNGSTKFEVDEFIGLLNGMQSIETIFESLYNTKLHQFIVLVECVWVYIYLCFENNMSIVEVLNSLQDSEHRVKVIQCKLETEIDNKILKTYKNIYDQISQ